MTNRYSSALVSAATIGHDIKTPTTTTAARVVRTLRKACSGGETIVGMMSAGTDEFQGREGPRGKATPGRFREEPSVTAFGTPNGRWRRRPERGVAGELQGRSPRPPRGGKISGVDTPKRAMMDGSPFQRRLRRSTGRLRGYLARTTARVIGMLAMARSAASWANSSSGLS